MERRKLIKKTRLKLTKKIERVKLIKKFQDICWVCERDVSPNDIYAIIGRNRNGDPIIRHSKCTIGSDRWLRSQIAKESKFYKLYKKEVIEANA